MRIILVPRWSYGKPPSTHASQRTPQAQLLPWDLPWHLGESACGQSPIGTRSIHARKSATHWAAWLMNERTAEHINNGLKSQSVIDHNQLRLVLREVSRLSGEKEVEWKRPGQACRKGPQVKGIASQLSRAQGEPANQHQTASWAHGSFFTD